MKAYFIVHKAYGFIIVLTIIFLTYCTLERIDVTNLFSSSKHLTSIETKDTKVKYQISDGEFSSTLVADDHHFCTWGVNRQSLGCQNMLTKQLLMDFATTPNTTKANKKVQRQSTIISKRWVFMGDSTMAMLFREFDKRITTSNACGCKHNVAPRCDMYDAFGLTKKKADWNPPREGLEGPYAHGLRNPHCQDCLNCNSILVQCPRFHPCSNGTTLSLLGVHFARDVEMQTEEGTNTTQESVALYLQNQQKCLAHPFICVVNTGFHDMRILNKDGETYINNVEWYLTLLKPCCIRLIWIQMTSVLEDENYPQRNSIVELWKAKVYALLQKEQFRNWTSIVDPYNASLFFPHIDNVHLNKSYYTALSDLFHPFFANK